MRILGLFIASVLLASCAAPTSVPVGFRMDSGSTQALVVGSITYESAIGRYSIEATERGGGQGFVAGVGSSDWAPGLPLFDEELKQKGGTFAVAVTPGQYTLQRWSVARSSWLSEPLGIPFRAEAGKVTYLGHFHFNSYGDVTLEDRADRDLPIMRKRIPAVAFDSPQVSIRAGTRVQNFGKPGSPAADPTLYGAQLVATPSASPGSALAFDPLTMASVQDSVDPRGGTPRGVRFFVVSEVDGKRVARNAASSSLAASSGLGPNMRVVDVERAVPAGKVRLKLRGSIGHAAPIQAIFAAVTSGGAGREAVGEVELDLQADARYKVNGVIDELRTEVWLEDAKSGQVIPGSRISAAPNAEAVKANSAPALFTCCNLRLGSERWISDANWLNEPILPAGTPIRIYEYGKDRAKAMIDGQVAWLGLDYGRKQQSVLQWTTKVAVKEDPSERIRQYPTQVQEAIRVGKVGLGMSKEQALVALGHPRVDLTPSTEESTWVYEADSEARFKLIWDSSQRLVAVEAAPELRARVLQTR